MDVDNGDGNIIKVSDFYFISEYLLTDHLQDLPCTKRLNQLVCTGAGSSYPDNSITTFISDNKALLRRMFGENQQQRPKTTTKTTVTLVRSFGHTR